MERTSIWLDKDDREVFAAIQQLYGCESFSHAVRLAGRIALQSGKLNVPLPATSRFSNKKPKAGKNGGFFAHMQALADEIELAGLPEDISERLDDYLYAEAREGLA